MAALTLTFPTLAVSATYCLWHAYRLVQLRRHQQLRERVAFMLWTAANEVE
jgi:hypothetical protein